MDPSTLVIGAFVVLNALQTVQLFVMHRDVRRSLRPPPPPLSPLDAVAKRRDDG